MTYKRKDNLLNSKFKELFFPTLLAAIAGNFALLADAFVISALLGSLNLSVVQSIEPLAQFTNMIYWLIGFGGTILATSAKANFDDEKANYLFTVSIIGIIIISLLITVLGFLFPDSFLQILCQSPHLKPLVFEYLKYYLLAIPLMSYFIVLAYFIKNDDFVQLQFRGFLLANILNVVFDIVLIQYFHMGISGAALGMVLGYLIAAIYISTYFFSSRRTLKFIKIEFVKSMKYLKDICKTGYPSSSIALYQSLKLIVINFIILEVLSHVGLVAFNMCCNALLLVSIFIFGTSQSILPIVTVYYQEKDYNGVDYVVRRSLKIAIAFGVFFTALFCIYPQSLLYLFSVNNPLDIPTVMNAVRIFSLCILAYSINFIYMFYLQSIQNLKLANIVTILNGLIFPVTFVFIFSIIWKENGIWFGFVASEIATLIFIYIYSKYLHKKTNGKYTGLFLKKQNDKDEKIMEYTIQGDKNDVSGLSKEVKQFIDDEKASLLISTALKEMIDYILDINDKLDWIDVIIRENNEIGIISIKYSGIGYNPEENPNLNSANIEKLFDISDNIEYSQILGLNNTVITIKK